MTASDTELIDHITAIAKDFIASDENKLCPTCDEPAWREPLIGVSTGDDPLHEEIKAHIGDYYWLPIEAFETANPDTDATASDLSVVCWVLPQTMATKREHRRSHGFPSRRWMLSRYYGEKINERLARHLVEALRDEGYEVLAPHRIKQWQRFNYVPLGPSSRWSERHACFVSGLGTFGLSHGLITPKGIAHRCGSIIIRARIPPTERPYDTHTAYCPYLVNGKCGACIRRCPAGAISDKGIDKEKCGEFHKWLHNMSRKMYGVDGHGCGLCQAGVPCESGIPRKLLK
ncbi:MAG TPA: epoxyqueuosine reductase [Methanomicrobia archaeon]|nr:epoxyqueuosine reductase [Methanomicrobia archaeon]